MNNDKTWKLRNKPPACTRPPWRYLIPYKDRPEILRKIRQECVEIYGKSFDECSKRLDCVGKDCVGRPLPWKSPTARRYLEQLKKTHKIVNEELYIEGCETCPLVKTCKKPCLEVIDSSNKTKSREPKLIYKDFLDNLQRESVEDTDLRTLNTKNIPWDILDDTKKEVIKKYVSENKDFKTIANQLGLTNQARVKYIFYSSLTKLSEYAIVREFIEENKFLITPKQLRVLNLIYKENKTKTEVAKELGLTKQSIGQILNRVFNKYNVKWKVFVKKKGTRVVYNTEEIVK